MILNELSNDDFVDGMIVGTMHATIWCQLSMGYAWDNDTVKYYLCLLCVTRQVFARVQKLRWHQPLTAELSSTLVLSVLSWVVFVILIMSCNHHIHCLHYCSTHHNQHHLQHHYHCLIIKLALNHLTLQQDNQMQSQQVPASSIAKGDFSPTLK